MGGRYNGRERSNGAAQRLSRFKKGVSGNPKGRPKRGPAPLAELVKGVLEAKVEYREAGHAKMASRRELAVRRHLKNALKGDISAAEAILKLRAHAAAGRNASSQLVQISDLLPSAPDGRSLRPKVK